ncbi:hypothetical protein Tsubulata_012049, partial [Turnera subulata]
PFISIDLKETDELGSRRILFKFKNTIKIPSLKKPPTISELKFKNNRIRNHIPIVSNHFESPLATVLILHNN